MAKTFEFCFCISSIFPVMSAVVEVAGPAAAAAPPSPPRAMASSAISRCQSSRKRRCRFLVASGESVVPYLASSCGAYFSWWG